MPESHDKMKHQVFTAVKNFVKHKDINTERHSHRVSEYISVLAKKIGHPSIDVDSLSVAATLHDLGKLVIPDFILFKVGRLSDHSRLPPGKRPEGLDERLIMNSHPVIGWELAKQIPLACECPHIKDVILWHHERWDGTGYPDCIKGDDIPLAAQIMAVVDAFDAMTSDRVYRAGLSFASAVEIVTEEKEKQFSPVVVDAFLARDVQKKLFAIMKK